MDITKIPNSLHAGDDVHSASTSSNVQSSIDWREWEQQKKDKSEDPKAMAMSLGNSISILQTQTLKLQDKLETSFGQQGVLENRFINLQEQLRDLSLPSFIYFSRLPSELRAKIWQYYPSPRVFQILDYDYFVNTSNFAEIKLPAILAVNHESRHEAQKLYKKWYSSHLRSLKIESGDDSSYIYFNPHIDTLLLDISSHSGWDKICQELSIHHLTVPVYDVSFDDIEDFYPPWSILKTFTIDVSSRVNILDGAGAELSGKDIYLDVSSWFSQKWVRKLYSWIRRTRQKNKLDNMGKDLEGYKVACEDIINFIKRVMASLCKNGNEQNLGPGADIFIKAGTFEISACDWDHEETVSDIISEETNSMFQRTEESVLGISRLGDLEMSF